MINNPSKPALSTRNKTFAVAALVWLLLTAGVYANNIAVTNYKLTGLNTTGHYTLVQFDISWENSWRTSSAPNNWDAAWVFVKYRVPVANGGDGLWKHAWLNDAGHTAPSGSTIDIGLLTPGTTFNPATNPGLGAFIYRNANGTGAFTKTGVQLRWNYGANSVADNAVVDIQVFAIEMVYVPTGSFYVGSGGTESGGFYKYPTTTNPYQIASEGQITVGTATDNLYYPNPSGSSGDRGGPIPATFPKGYNAFYCMKYEISQQGYVDFLNSLTQTQATTRKYTSAQYRYAISGSTVGGYTTANPYVSCNYLAWADLAAWLDWSGLRPMTELEFEKACRGTGSAVPNEYTWGSTSITAATGISNGGLNNETASNSGANTCYANSGTGGPMRVGAFATSSSIRVTAGATYYGIMEMSGNLWERPVTVGNTTGRAFTGAHGDGNLNATGDANASAWPGTDAVGAGFRGGAWDSDATYLRASDRSNAASATTSNSLSYGGRGVRGVFSIGQSYGGGIIFYIDGTGQHGLISATSDQSLGVQWGCYGTSIPGTSTAIGTGQANTTAIVAGCPTIGIAAQICDALVLNGYSDWFLPSKDELYQMYLQKTVIGGIANPDYCWSSSEDDAYDAYVQDLYGGLQGAYFNKSGPGNVRAVRAF